MFRTTVQNKKLSSNTKNVLIAGFFSIAGILIQRILGILPMGANCKNYDISLSGNDNKSIIGDHTQYIENIKQPLPLEIENEKLLEDNKAKITALFRYWNDREYDMARNTIDKDISYIFTPEKVVSFREHLTQIINIIDMEQEGEISNSDFLSYSKHIVSIGYAYEGQFYQEKWDIVVERSKRDPKQHHITMFKCIEGNGPLCTDFSQ